MTKLLEPKQARSTRFTCHAPEAKAVFLAGTFNGWSQQSTPTAKDAAGDWSVAVDLKPGRYEYKFVVDGSCCCEPGCEKVYQGSPKCVPNPFGTMNRVIEVA